MNFSSDILTTDRKKLLRTEPAGDKKLWCFDLINSHTCAPPPPPPLAANRNTLDCLILPGNVLPQPFAPRSSSSDHWAVESVPDTTGSRYFHPEIHKIESGQSQRGRRLVRPANANRLTAPLGTPQGCYCHARTAKAQFQPETGQRSHTFPPSARSFDVPDLGWRCWASWC